MKYYKYVLLILVIVSPPLQAQDAFQEVGLDWGIEHFHRGTMGGGVAILDFNNDGFEDLYFTGGTTPDKLYKNNGNKTFTDVSIVTGIRSIAEFNTMSANAGDINNDGFDDLFIGTAKSVRDILLLNNGDNTFTDISQTAGLIGVDWTMGATFGDFNLDGFLDLYTIGYIDEAEVTLDENGEPNGFAHQCYPNKLYLNNGNLTFSEVGASSGTNDAGCGLAASSTDLNNDNIPDVYVANDFGEWVIPNVAYTNDHPSQTFTDISESSGLNVELYGMGIAVGDYNRDGLFDYYVSNLGSNVLHLNEGDGTFTDMAAEAGVLNTNAGDELAISWGTAFLDYDLDGYEDLYMSNGFVPTADFVLGAQKDPNKLFRNNGDGTFEDRSAAEAVDDDSINRGLAIGDFDNDGDPDIVSTVIGLDAAAGNVQLYENLHESDNRWLRVLVTGVEANLNGFGTKVKAYREGVVWVHEVDGGSSHASQHGRGAYFGLGAVDQLDSVVIIWPGGKKQKFEDIETDQILHLEENANTLDIVGCTSSTADNFNPDATFDYGCFTPKEGCLDQRSTNFDITANIDSGDCVVTSVDDRWISELLIYPNPSSAQISIKLPEMTGVAEIELTNLSGQVLRKTSTTSNYTLERGNLKSGVYLLRITTREGVFSQKVVLR